jgi:hypothetical protein
MSVTQVQVQHRPWQAASFSFVLHLCLILGLVWLVKLPERHAEAESLRRVSVVLAQADKLNSNSMEYLSEPPLDESNSKLDGLQSTTLPAVNDLPATPVLKSTTPDPPPMDLASLTIGAAGMANSSNPAGGNTNPLSAEDTKAIADEQNELANQLPLGPTATTSIFGSAPLTGRRFVFVIDRSKSMGSQGLGVLDRAQIELLKALAPLTAEHSFQVVAYHQQTTMLSRRTLLAATDENKNIVREFISDLAPYGSTDHEAGLFMALSLEPDVIVLLTDGDTPELNDGQIDSFVKANRGDAEVHCVQFGLTPIEPTSSFMQRIARKTGGSYRYINVNDWQRGKK